MRISKIGIGILFLVALIFTSLAFAQQKPAAAAAPAQEMTGIMMMQVKAEWASNGRIM